MIKPQVISFKDKKSDQAKEELAMTPEQRLELAFQLIELSITITPSKELYHEDKTIQWIDLHLTE